MGDFEKKLDPFLIVFFIAHLSCLDNPENLINVKPIFTVLNEHFII